MSVKRNECMGLIPSGGPVDFVKENCLFTKKGFGAYNSRRGPWLFVYWLKQSLCTKDGAYSSRVRPTENSDRTAILKTVLGLILLQRPKIIYVQRGLGLTLY